MSQEREKTKNDSPLTVLTREVDVILFTFFACLFRQRLKRQGSIKLSANWTTFIEETNKKENMIVLLPQTNPSVPSFHIIISNEQNPSIDILREESKESIETVLEKNPFKSAITWLSSQGDKDSPTKNCFSPQIHSNT